MDLSNRIPPGIQIQDLVLGSGRQAQSGDLVRVRLQGSLNRGESIDGDREAGDLVSFRIGERTVIPGLERGVIGMHVGGARKLRISPHLAYGDAGVPGKIPPNAVIVYEVNLLACESPQPNDAGQRKLPREGDQQ